MDFDLIIPGLYVGNMKIDRASLSSLNIKLILSLGFDHPIMDDIPCKFFPLCDHPSEDIYRHFDHTFEIIDQILQENENIYVHCIAGISRSPSIAVAYLMRRNQWSLRDALHYVQVKRPIADPNSGFIEQLKLYQKTGFKVDTNSPIYHRYMIISKFRIDYDIDYESSNSQKPISKQCQILKCKSCRYRLITEPENLLYHTPIDSRMECAVFYISPTVEWIPIEEHMIQGKIVCPGCNAKLGKFNWSGIQCTCTKWIAPGFSLQRSKVDVDVANALKK